MVSVLGLDNTANSRPLRLGGYEVVRQLGRGGMACVYEGRHVELGHRVAIKLLGPGLASDPRACARFAREAKAASQIRHQNVVQVYDVGMEQGQPFLVMEFLDGVDLATLVARHGPLPPAGLVELFLPILSGVKAAHEAGIIHRDLKPANVMVVRRPPHGPQPVVLDFGISKLEHVEEPGTPLTRSECLLGTMHYLAPELTRGAERASPLSDQYSLGVMLYECAAGRRPFGGTNHYQVLQAILSEPVVPLDVIRSDFPSELAEIIARAMHRDPAKRYPSVQALGSALLGFGGKRAWALWEAEFVSQHRSEAALWEVTATTVSENAPALLPEARRTPRFRRSLAGRRRALVFSVLATAGGASVVHSCTEPRGVEPGVAARRSEPTPAPPAAPVPAVSAAYDAKTTEPSLLVPVATPTAIALDDEHVPESSGERSRASAPREPARGTTASKPMLSTRVERVEKKQDVRVATGTNGALIVE
ncbi:MAG: serine/threonine-protein kinase [Pseudomonadota bacterium]